MRRQQPEHYKRRLKRFREKRGRAYVVEVPTTAVELPEIRNYGRLAFRFLEIVGLLFIIPTAYVLVVDLEDRQSQRTAQAWELVTIKSPGNSGKIQALNYLNSESCLTRERKALFYGQKLYRCGLSVFSWPQKKQESLRGIDLSIETHGSSVYLRGVVLSKADLYEANLSGADLDGADLYEANLSDTNMSGVNLWKADLSGARLFNALLTGAYLREANLSGVGAASADLFDADLYEANLSDANLWKANLSDAFVSNADLSGADLQEADLSLANLSGANLIGAFVRGADLSAANLSGANLSSVDLRNANLSGADLSSANLSGADLQEANLSGANLSGADLREANLFGADLSLSYFGKIPELHVSSERQIVFFPITKTNPTYFKGMPPVIDPSLLKYFIPIDRPSAIDCIWTQGAYHFSCD